MPVPLRCKISNSAKMFAKKMSNVSKAGAGRSKAEAQHQVRTYLGVDDMLQSIGCLALWHLMYHVCSFHAMFPVGTHGL